MLFLLLLSRPSSFILFSILFLSSSFLIRSCDAQRRRFFQRAKSCQRFTVSNNGLLLLKQTSHALSYSAEMSLTLCQWSSSSSKLLYCSCMRSYRDWLCGGMCPTSSSLSMSLMLTLLVTKKTIIMLNKLLDLLMQLEVLRYTNIVDNRLSFTN